MKKIWIMMLLAVGMIACSEKNTPDDSTAADSTATVSPGGGPGGW